MDEQHWPSLSDRLLVNIANQMLLHLIRYSVKFFYYLRRHLAQLQRYRDARHVGLQRHV